MTDAGGAHASGPWVDLRFRVEGGPLPLDHRRGLARAVAACLPWLEQQPDVAIRLEHLSLGAGGCWLVSQRTRLLLRLPAKRTDDAKRLAGSTLPLGDGPLRVGQPGLRDLRPWGTLFAQLVVSEGRDELHFMEHVAAELTRLNIGGRPICGRMQASVIDDLKGFSLMVDGLGAEQARRLMACGLGPHRHLGCGLFVPHKSAAAVGSPD